MEASKVVVKSSDSVKKALGADKEARLHKREPLFCTTG